MSRRGSQPLSEETLKVLASFQQGYGAAPRPAVYGDPSHCEECSAAHTLLMDRTPEDLDPEEFSEPSRSWFFAWMGEEGWRHFLPGFVRLAVLDPGKHAGLLLDHLESEYFRTLKAPQRAAIHTVLVHVATSGVDLSPTQRRALRQALDATRGTTSVDGTV